MPIFTETWSQEQFQLRQDMNLADVPETALRVVKDLPFEFEDYKANQRLACWQYERGLLECYNNLGVIESKKNAQCVTVANFLDRCKNQHKMIGIMKTYMPERFAVSKYSRAVPSAQEVLDL